MKRLHLLIQHIALCLLATVAVMASSCVDRMFYDSDDIPEGVSTVDVNLGFAAFTPALESRASGTAIKNINSLWLVIYKPDGSFVEKREITNFDKEKLEPNTRPDGTESSEQQTGHVSFKLTLDNGYYLMYAVANHDLSAIADDEINTPSKLKELDLVWQNDSAEKNAQMFGWFVNGGKDTDHGTDAPIVTIRDNNSTLHAWVRRAASKLTIAFDTRNLNENIYIYLKSITIKDIPKHCYLHRANAVGADDYTLKSELVNGQTLYFGNAKPEHVDGKESHSQWARIACGDTIYGLHSDRLGDLPEGSSYADRLAAEHAEATEALYFYENMQPEGRLGTVTDKRQDVFGNSIISFPFGTFDGSHDEYGNLLGDSYDRGWKDGKAWGSYVEVEAYYVSNSGSHPGKGNIIYRFMLGKNTTTNYEAERNHHYRLTMKFNNNANDVDFHIDYKEEAKPGLFTPDTTYVSYSYNQPASMSVRATPLPGYDFVNFEAVIIDNEWRPDKDPNHTYYFYTAWDYQTNYKDAYSKKWVYSESEEGDWEKDAFYQRDSEIKPNTEFGFLSLRYVATVTQDFGQRNQGYGGYPTLVRKIRRAYFKPQKNTNMSDDERAVGGPLNWREYKEDIPTTDGSATHEDPMDGNYTFTRTTNPNTGEIDYVGEIPLYTRAKTLDAWAVYSGANPFYEHQRMARVKFTAHYRYNPDSGEPQVKGDTYTDVSYTYVMQTERVDNPRGIYRAYNNDDEFAVRLCYGKDAFEQVISKGPWTATIERDPQGLVQLSANGSTVTGEGSSVSGRTLTPVQFTYKPTSKLTDSKSVRGAIITVTYHNNSCVHKILVRQGYAPLTLGENGKVQWSTFNVYNNKELVRSPLSVGSLFRRHTTLDYPILERNNDTYPVAVDPGANGTLKICNSGDTTWTTMKWDNIPGLTDATANAFTSMNLNNHNDGVSNKYKLPTFNDLVELGITTTETSQADKDRANDYNSAFGITYADGAKKTMFDSRAYSYKDYGNVGIKNECGVRGIIVYSLSDADNVLFPLGASGHARRKSRYFPYDGKNIYKVYGTMRYGSVDTRLEGTTNNIYRPLAWDIPSQFGAGYWINSNTGSKKQIAIDFNYGNYMGGYLGDEDLYTDGSGTKLSDALPIRPIHE